MSRILGIDLGTTNSCACVMEAGERRVIIHYDLPLAEVVFGFYDRMKSISRAAWRGEISNFSASCRSVG